MNEAVLGDRKHTQFLVVSVNVALPPSAFYTIA